MAFAAGGPRLVSLPRRVSAAETRYITGGLERFWGRFWLCWQGRPVRLMQVGGSQGVKPGSPQDCCLRLLLLCDQLSNTS